MASTPSTALSNLYHIHTYTHTHTHSGVARFLIPMVRTHKGHPERNYEL